jgi:competence protein ComEA
MLLASAWAWAVDLNTADPTTLAALPGLGPTRAAALVVHRNRHGPFTSLAEVAEVPGIGPASVRLLRGQVSLGPTSTPVAVDTPLAVEARHPVVATVRRLNPNTATSAELATWPGFTGDRAAAVVRERQAHGPYDGCADLVRADGIGPATVALLRDVCVVVTPSATGPSRTE